MFSPIFSPSIIIHKSCQRFATNGSGLFIKISVVSTADWTLWANHGEIVLEKVFFLIHNVSNLFYTQVWFAMKSDRQRICMGSIFLLFQDHWACMTFIFESTSSGNNMHWTHYFHLLNSLSRCVRVNMELVKNNKIIQLIS